jgi:hypothetical protein
MAVLIDAVSPLGAVRMTLWFLPAGTENIPGYSGTRIRLD